MKKGNGYEVSARAHAAAASESYPKNMSHNPSEKKRRGSPVSAGVQDGLGEHKQISESPEDLNMGCAGPGQIPAHKRRGRFY